MPNFFVAGAVVACRRRGYHRVADLIRGEQLTPERIGGLFSASASKSVKETTALAILAGSIAKSRAAPAAWSPEPAASLARELVGADFARVSAEAANLVHRHWRLIEELAGGAAAV
jgi:hypothetical protein